MNPIRPFQYYINNSRARCEAVTEVADFFLPNTRRWKRTFFWGTPLKAEHRVWVVSTPASLSGRSQSNLSPYFGYTHWCFSWLSSVPPSKCWDDTLNWATTVSFFVVPNSLFYNQRFVSYATEIAFSISPSLVRSLDAHIRFYSLKTMLSHRCFHCLATV
jgi:hypothetical protein